mgnify:CR=1 FL=1
MEIFGIIVKIRYICNMKIIMPIGISGSGKTRLYHKRYEGMTLVSPDEIRKEISGSISNQKCNNQVFKKGDAMVESLVRDNIDFYYDATNCNPTFRKEFVERFRGSDVKIVYMVLPCDMESCRMRIKTDLKNKVDRSNVPFEVLIRQKGFYNQSIKSGFEGENVQEIIYLKPEDLI